MREIVLLGFVASLAALSGCDSASPLLPEKELLVVRAYLYAEEPVTDVQLTSTFALTSNDATGRPINDAKVSLEKAGKFFPLIASPGDSGYYHYAGNDLAVRAGDHFEISVEHNGQITTGETIIPAPPQNVALTQNEILIDTNTPFDTSSITVSWQEEDTFYFVVVENLEASPTPINQSPFPGGPRAQLKTLRSRPIRENRFNIQRVDLTYFGEHRVKVYKVNREYANLYAFGLQDSRHLNEPETNIKNGLGIFAGFNSAAAHFVVRQK
ncbi:MAG: DUF4249 family protein [bacterium]